MIGVTNGSGHGATEAVDVNVPRDFEHVFKYPVNVSLSMA